MRSVFFIIILFFFSAHYLHQKPSDDLKYGKYIMDLYFTYSYMDVSKNGSFESYEHSCTYAYEYKGTWKIKGDTLIASPSLIKRGRDEKAKWKTAENIPMLYLVRPDMLISIDSTKDGALALFDTLMWHTKVKPRKKL